MKDYALPPDYQRTLERPNKIPAPKPARPPKQEEAVTENDPERADLDTYWAALTPDEQTAFEEEAVKLADRFLLGQYQAGREAQGMVYRSARQLILDQHIRRTLAASKAA